MPRCAANTRKLIKLRWSTGYAPFRTPLDLPICRRLTDVIDDGMGQRPLLLPTLGGSVPIALFREALELPVIIVPTVNHDNHQHAANENLRLKDFFQSIELFAVIFAGLSDA